MECSGDYIFNWLHLKYRWMNANVDVLFGFTECQIGANFFVGNSFFNANFVLL